MSVVAAAAAVAVLSAATVLNESLAGRQVFPVTNWWNLDVSAAPLDPQSSAYISWIGTARQVHPDFGPPPYGIPYVVVDGTQPRVPVTFDYDDESDVGIAGLDGYPIPSEALTQPHYIEGDVPGGGSSGDRHLLMIDRDRWILYELYATRWNAAASRWDAGSGAIFDLSSNARAPPRGARRRPPRDSRSCPASCATTRCTARRRSRTRSASRRGRRTVTYGRPRIAPGRPPARRRSAPASA
jgi:hypothetical protein